MPLFMTFGSRHASTGSSHPPNSFLLPGDLFRPGNLLRFKQFVALWRLQAAGLERRPEMQQLQTGLKGEERVR
jgi:hypothetical protein